jgi:hypothetical protein
MCGCMFTEVHILSCKACLCFVCVFVCACASVFVVACTQRCEAFVCDVNIMRVLHVCVRERESESERDRD